MTREPEEIIQMLIDMGANRQEAELCYVKNFYWDNYEKAPETELMLCWEWIEQHREK